MPTPGDNATTLIRIGQSAEFARLQAIDKVARSRYATLAGFEFAAHTPPIAAERLGAGETWVAASAESIVGFILLEPHVGSVYVANISVLPEASGRGIGARLIAQAMSRAAASRAAAVTLTTFRAPPWNGPWFRRQGFEAMPENRIGPNLRAILDRHARSLDMSTRETLWRQVGSQPLPNPARSR
jgi:N-acetylglutamate synthase-like GNAT family acetyltransferase